MASILGVGIAVLDIVNFVDHYPQEDEEMRAESQQKRRGGNVSNTLSVLAQFNHECHWCGTIADDLNGKFVLQDLKYHNINTVSAIKIKNSEQPTSYITLNRENGSRTIVHYRQLPELNFTMFDALRFPNFTWAHFEAREILSTVGMIKKLRNLFPSIVISIEVEKARTELEKIFNLADIYLFSRKFVESTFKGTPENFLIHQKSLSPNADLVCAWGEKGAFALLKDGKQLFSAAYPVSKVRDSIGAGDTFCAGIIHARLSQKSWEETLDFANRLAGKKCEQEGFDKLAERCGIESN